MTKRHLLEAASLAATKPSEDGSWAVRLISEGRGSSGVYTRELLENYYHAFDDVLSFLNHPAGSPTERNFTEIAGRIKANSVRFVEEEDGTGAIYGDYLPDPQYADKLERYKDKLGLSIYISGTGYIEESSGDFIVETFDADDPFRSVDIVHAPGAQGRFLESMKEVYSTRVEEQEPTTTAVEDERNKKMELEAKVDKALELLATLIADKAEKSVEAAQVSADAEAVKTAVEHYAAAVKAVDAAELFESQREAILAQAAEGKDVSELIESAKVVREEAVKAVQETAQVVEGAVLGGGATQFSLTKIAEAE